MMVSAVATTASSALIRASSPVAIASAVSALCIISSRFISCAFRGASQGIAVACIPVQNGISSSSSSSAGGRERLVAVATGLLLTVARATGFALSPSLFALPSIVRLLAITLVALRSMPSLSVYFWMLNRPEISTASPLERYLLATSPILSNATISTYVTTSLPFAILLSAIANFVTCPLCVSLVSGSRVRWPMSVTLLYDGIIFLSRDRRVWIFSGCDIRLAGTRNCKNNKACCVGELAGNDTQG